jgi:hypothetical protein
MTAPAAAGPRLVLLHDLRVELLELGRERLRILIVFKSRYSHVSCGRGWCRARGVGMRHW